jgi:hypothetical protein
VRDGTSGRSEAPRDRVQKAALMSDAQLAVLARLSERLDALKVRL